VACYRAEFVFKSAKKHQVNGHFQPILQYTKTYSKSYGFIGVKFLSTLHRLQMLPNTPNVRQIEREMQ
jgi:hypothetical protein